MMPLTETGALGATGASIAALAIGFAFGWCLERAGLGSAPKLAGQFYLRDLTVFKVLFSALVTAMLGAFWLDRLGLLDLNLVYLPETFAAPQAIGGVLFGAGFLVAGLCPGTSCVAAAAGRIDGLAVIGGMLFGILLFNVSYSQMEGLYSSTAWGAITVADVLGTSHGVVIAAITAAALGAFALIGRPFIAARQPAALAGAGDAGPHRGLVTVAVALALAAVAVDLQAVDARPLATEIEQERDHISAPDLAQLIISGDRTLHVLDLRSRAEFDHLHIAGAKHASLELLSRDPLPRDATVVLYSEGGAHAAQAWVLLRMRGYRRVFFLREGLFEWIARVMEPRLALDATASERADFLRAVEMSRFFGGSAREGVPRSEVPVGYWNSPSHGAAHGTRDATAAPGLTTDRMVARIRRRGC